MAGCGSAWHVDEWTKLLPGGRERTFSLRHGGFGRCHGAVGLMTHIGIEARPPGTRTEDAERTMTLFAREVMPVLKAEASKRKV